MHEVCALTSVIIASRWRVGGAVTQRSAKPRRRVRLPYVPPHIFNAMRG